MKLTFNGHACVTLVASDGRTVVMDPYRSGAFGGRLSHAPLRIAADVVTVTHYHVDHSHVGPELADEDGVLPPIVDRSGSAAGFDFVVRMTYHDRVGGTHMGMTGMVAFEIDGLRVAHLGDIGCDLTPEDVAALGPIDILLWPVGGTYTLGPEDAQGVLTALKPRLAIPLHFEHPRCQLGMQPIEALLPHLDAFERPGDSGFDTEEGLPTGVLVLEPAL
ncbi:MAG: MBL fold metallo-hydrolase [Myxococcota bacterium]